MQSVGTEGKASTSSESEAPQGSPKGSTSSFPSNTITYMKIKRKNIPEAENSREKVQTRVRSK